ncbi:hypothetical protein NUSPORA_01265 [Nucleospora cyclopteri]
MMLLANIAVTLALEIILRTNTSGEMFKDIAEHKTDASLGDEQAVVVVNGIESKYETFKAAREAVKKFKVLKNLPSNLKEISEHLKNLKRDEISDLKSGVFNFAVIFTDLEEHLRILEKLEIPENFKVMFSTDKNYAKSLNVSFPGIYGYNAVERNSFALEFPQHAASIISNIAVKSFEKIETETIRYFQTISVKMLYFINNTEQPFEEIAEKYREKTKKFAGEFKTIFFTPEDVPVLNKLIQIDPSDYPVILLMEEDKKYICRKVTPENIEENIEKFRAGNAERIKFSSEIPEDNNSRAIKVMNTETVAEIRKDLSKDKIFFFSSPNCNYCRQFKPILEKLSNEFLNKSIDILIGEYNMIENENIPELNLGTVPAIFYQKKGSDIMHDIRDKRSIKDLLEYVSKEGVSAKVAIEEFLHLLPAEEKKHEEEEVVEEPLEDEKQQENEKLL